MKRHMNVVKFLLSYLLNVDLDSPWFVEFSQKDLMKKLVRMSEYAQGDS
jgi:hypothetical protein